jgi:hypothetical protein
MSIRYKGCSIHQDNRGRAGIVCILHLAVWMAIVPSASATVLLPVDFTTVVTESMTIVHGRVSDVSAGLTGPRRTIESVVTLEVIEALKGALPADRTVSFRVPNGQLGRYRRVVVGAPEFARGDEVVVFLRGKAPAIPTLYGLSQGVYRVTRDRNAGLLVMPAPVLAQGLGAERVVRGDPVRRPLSIDAFARQVRTIAEGRR